MKHDDRLDAWLTALRHEMAQACMARACELPEKVMLGDDLPDDMPPDGGGLGPWRWLGVDALKIKNPEVMILGKDSVKMERNVKGIGEAALLAALFNAAKPDKQDAMYSRHENTATTLTTDHDRTIIAHKNEAVALQGNIIDRDAGMNGAGVGEDVSFTLNTVDRHGVA